MCNVRLWVRGVWCGVCQVSTHACMYNTTPELCLKFLSWNRRVIRAIKAAYKTTLSLCLLVFDVRLLIIKGHLV